VFNLTGYTPLQSAQRANLYEAFFYLSAKKAEAKYLEKLQKEQLKKQ
jgi:hypothetical protein